MDNRLNILRKLAIDSKSRSQLEKELKAAKKTYDKSRIEFDRNKSIAEDAAQKADLFQAQMIEARKQIIDINQYTTNMDLTGATAIKSRGDESSYLIDDKEYGVDISDVNDIKCIPWKEYKKQKDETKEEDDHAIDDKSFYEFNDFNDCDAKLDDYYNYDDGHFSSGHRLSEAMARAVYIIKSGN
jgi:hypothetical protein